MSENDFECFASTGVNTPVAMSPNVGCREVQLPRSRLLDRVGLFLPITSELLVTLSQSREGPLVA